MRKIKVVKSGNGLALGGVNNSSRQVRDGAIAARFVIPYGEALTQAKRSGDAVNVYLRRELPRFWETAYYLMSDRPSDIVVFTYGSFDYWFDTYQQQEVYDPKSGIPPVEARLIAAIGQSAPQRSARDDSRRRGLMLSAMPGVDAKWDKGHFIGHSIGGTVDGNEANVFYSCVRLIVANIE